MRRERARGSFGCRSAPEELVRTRRTKGGTNLGDFEQLGVEFVHLPEFAYSKAEANDSPEVKGGEGDDEDKGEAGEPAERVSAGGMGESKGRTG